MRTGPGGVSYETYRVQEMLKVRAEVHDPRSLKDRAVLSLLETGVATMKNKNKITSVSLDPETYAIAKSMDNRSAFIRECFRRWYQHENTSHLHPTETNKCYPHSKKGRCLICWPNGIPSQQDWLYYRETGRGGQPYADDWIDSKVESSEFPIPREFHRKLADDSGVKRSFMQKFLAKLRLKR